MARWRAPARDGIEVAPRSPQEDRPIVREDEKDTGVHTPVAPAHRRSASRRRNTLNDGDRTMARSVPGLFTEQTQVDRIV